MLSLDFAAKSTPQGYALSAFECWPITGESLFDQLMKE